MNSSTDIGTYRSLEIPGKMVISGDMEEIHISNSVPQSLMLGPLQFFLHTCSLGDVISLLYMGIHATAILADVSSWIYHGSHQLKLNTSKIELLYIPAASPCQDLVISLYNAQISHRSLHITLDNHGLSFFASHG